MRGGRIAILFLVIPILAFSQSRDTVFTVKAAQSGISLYPKTTVLYKDLTKRFKLIKPGTIEIDTVIFIGGTFSLKDSVLLLKPTGGKTALLKIYRKLPEGKFSLAFVQEFGIQKFVEPKPNLDGVDCDSFIHRMKVVAQGYVNVPMRPGKELKRFSYPVISFDAQISGNGMLRTLSTSGNRMSYEMRDKADSLKDGSLVNIFNIRYVMQADTLTIRQPLRVYIVNDTIVKF